MSRLSGDEYRDGILWNGFDYTRQAWVKDGKYLRCGHPDSMRCGCFGREHEGEPSQEAGTGEGVLAMDSENIRYTYGVDPRTDYNNGVPPADMKDPLWIEGRWYERDEPMPWETRVRQLEQEGLTRSDAQAVVDAEDAKKIPQSGNLFE